MRRKDYQFRIIFLFLVFVLVLAGRKEDETVKRKLAAHGVDKALHNEIIGMTSASMTRRDIVNHVKGHFPKKSQSEVNDIVLAAALAAGKPLPKKSATTAAEERVRVEKQKEFNMAKKKMQDAKRRQRR